MAKICEVVATFPNAFLVWMGPFLPVLSLVHPDYIKPIATASGIVVGSGDCGKMGSGSGGPRGHLSARGERSLLVVGKRSWLRM